MIIGWWPIVGVFLLLFILEQDESASFDQGYHIEIKMVL